MGHLQDGRNHPAKSPMSGIACASNPCPPTSTNSGKGQGRAIPRERACIPLTFGDGVLLSAAQRQQAATTAPRRRLVQRRAIPRERATAAGGQAAGQHRSRSQRSRTDRRRRASAATGRERAPPQPRPPQRARPPHPNREIEQQRIILFSRERSERLNNNARFVQFMSKQPRR